MQFFVMEMSINCFAAKYNFHEHVMKHAMLGIWYIYYIY